MSNVQTRAQREQDPHYRLNPEAIPEDLKALDRWVLWRLEKRDGGLTKVPYTPTPDWASHKASSTDPRTWRPWPIAFDIAQREALGVGLVLDGSDDLIAIDLDAKPELSPAALEILDQCHSYTEVSPSGQGRRIFLRGQVPEGFTGARATRLGIEVYRTGRYLTVTGDRVNGHEHVLADQATADGAISLTTPPSRLPAGAIPSSDTPPPEDWEVTATRNSTGDDSADDHAYLKDLLRIHPDGDWAWAQLEAAAPRAKLDRPDYRRRSILRAWAEVKAEHNVVEDLLLGADQVASARGPFSLGKALSRVPAPHFLIEGVLMRGHITALLGAPNAGKTGVAVDMAMHLAAGQALGGRRVERTRVFYVGVENPDDVILRIRVWCLHHGIDPEGLEDWFYFLPRAVDLANPAHVERLAEAIREQLGGAELGLLVLDTFASLFTGESENNATDVMIFFNNLRNHLVAPLRCAALVLHHPPKNSTDIHNWRGSSAALGTLDNIWGTESLDDGSITVSQGKRRAPPFPDLQWRYSLHQVPGMEDNFGNPVQVPLMVMDGEETTRDIYKVPALWARILSLLNTDPATSLRALGQYSGMDRPHPEKVRRELQRMKRASLVAEVKDGWRLTKDGTDVLARSNVTEVGDTL